MTSAPIPMRCRWLTGSPCPWTDAASARCRAAALANARDPGSNCTMNWSKVFCLPPSIELAWPVPTNPSRAIRAKANCRTRRNGSVDKINLRKAWGDQTCRPDLPRRGRSNAPRISFVASKGVSSFPENAAAATPVDRRWGRPVSIDHGQVQALFPRAVTGDLVARIGMPHHAGARVVPKYARQAPVGRLGPVGHDDHAAVLAVAHAHAAAMVQRHPGRAAGDIQHRIQQGPVRHGV